MQKSGQFILMNRSEFKNWLYNSKFTRRITLIQNHHTWLPCYKQFKGNNHFEMANGMRNSHLKRGFSDIAQNLTIYPDGKIMVCRPFNTAPAGIKGANSTGICIENIGDFDIGGDTMLPEHRESILFVNAILAIRFGLPINTNSIVYHHWYDLNTGQRRDGKGATKTCPGTAFFGGNTVAAASKYFIPLVAAKANEIKSGKVESVVSHNLGSRVLGIGDSGSDVIELKKRLIPLGYNLDKTVSKFDTYTKNSVEHLQGKNGLKVDGLVGKATLNLINVKLKELESKKEEIIKEVIKVASKYFKDVDANHYSAKHIDSLYEKGVTSGTSKDTYSPRSSVSREDVAVMIDRAIEYTIKEIEKKFI
ncbi:peptidoglycan-binding protein [Aneurinibacillus migulanus]|uniref:peptidoglycan-binding protein n=1 Tax=Aneurinibacillus migulanus TaxID=47500 RepID=UPI0020A20317|nr:peptidoglycan-binding protein [Aneurinibacillus migulanus]MCP1357743.1 peptidoglycan-binding protein [Aneurinibacillus migulanus]